LSLIERLHRAQAEVLANQEDPWRHALERALPANLVCTSSVALLAPLDFPATTGNARRLARTMRSMGWVGIKSRRLAPGGWRTTECRGWARPFRKIMFHEDGHPDVSLSDWETFRKEFSPYQFAAVLDRTEILIDRWFVPLARGVVIATPYCFAKLAFSLECDALVAGAKLYLASLGET
jgi:hypothetical protein